MPKSKCVIDDSEALAAEIAKEIDEMNNTGFGSSTQWAIGEYLGMEVHILITRDESDMTGVEPENNLLTFSDVK